MNAAGRAMGQALVDGIKALADASLAPIRNLFKFAVEIDWPEPPAWLGWIIGKGKDAVSSVRNAVGGSDTPAPAAASGMGGSPAVQNMLSGMDRLAAGAKSDLEQGGQAVAAGGEQAGGLIEAAGHRFAAIINAGADTAAAKISSARVNVSTSGGGVGGAIRDAKAGALHGGTD